MIAWLLSPVPRLLPVPPVSLPGQSSPVRFGLVPSPWCPSGSGPALFVSCEFWCEFWILVLYAAFLFIYLFYFCFVFWAKNTGLINKTFLHTKTKTCMILRGSKNSRDTEPGAKYPLQGKWNRTRLNRPKGETFPLKYRVTRQQDTGGTERRQWGRGESNQTITQEAKGWGNVRKTSKWRRKQSLQSKNNQKVDQPRHQESQAVMNWLGRHSELCKQTTINPTQS